ncbi:MAG TPA: ATP-binding protein [Spongiibacteraceae bacterium]|nr:ATP-binding protein [Spongiibacteraceae bacterium]
MLRLTILIMLVVIVSGAALLISVTTSPSDCAQLELRVLPKALSADNVRAFAALDAAGKTRPYTGSYLPDTSSPTWVAVDIRSAQQGAHQIWLADDEALWEDVAFYRHAGNEQPTYRFGLALPYDQRPVRSPGLIVPVEMTSSTATVYLRLASRHMPTFDPVACTPEVMAYHLRRVQFPTAFNIGFLACVNVFALLLLTAARSPLSALVFGLATASATINAFVGGAFTGAVQNNPALLHAIYIVGTIGTHWFILEGVLWLAAETALPRWWSLGLRSIRWVLVLTGVAYLIAGQDWSYAPLFVLASSAFFLAFVTSVLCYRHLHSELLFFVMGIWLFSTTVALSWIGALNLIEQLPGSHNWFSYGLTLMCLSFALSVIGRLYRDLMTLRGAQTQRAAAEAELAAQEHFLATMSHEIRTPLNGMLGTAELVGNSKLDPEQQRLMSTLIQSGRVLNEIISDILDFSRIRSGRLQLETQSFLIDETICQSLRLFRPLADSKGLSLYLRYAPELPLWVVGDAVRLQQILSNLFSNAIKFTDHGDVTLQLEHRVLADGQHMALCFKVIDTGVGIEPAILARIFEPFEQAELSTTRRYGGSGLGLAICRSLALLMDGNLQAESQPGQGSCFTLQLTLPIDWEREHARRRIDDLFRGGRYLLVSTDAARRHYRAQHFREHGVIVEETDDFEGLAARCRSHTGEHHLVLFDHVDLEDGDFEWSQLLQQPLPVLVISPRLRELPPALRQAPERFGLIWVPGTFSEWQTEIARLLKLDISHCPGLVLHPLETRDQALAGRRVLIVEDNTVNRMVLRKMLESFGAQVVDAEHGRIGLQCLAEGGPFDVVLMDMEMPVMDGLSATRAIRAQEQATPGRHQLIVGITAHAFETHLAACRAAGMDRVISKPIGSARLLALLLELLTPGSAP